MFVLCVIVLVVFWWLIFGFKDSVCLNVLSLVVYVFFFVFCFLLLVVLICFVLVFDGFEVLDCVREHLAMLWFYFCCVLFSYW